MNFPKIIQNHGSSKNKGNRQGRGSFPLSCYPSPFFIHLIVAGFCLFTPYPAFSLSTKIAKRSVCYQQSLELLTTRLLRDLPNYANRASQRSRRLARKTDIFSYVLLAGKPEFKPLPVKSYGNTAEGTISPEVKQVFFTTLERQYIGGKVVEFEEFHWLLLTKAESGWRRVMMFSQTGSSQPQILPTPPRESSNGHIGQAVDLWLRDCRAGTR